ncbi:MAG: hypothetical protein II035_03125 [Firmicutes bacterium]|nr:hypothetical protein [Bacillota bacterium]
MNIFSSFTDWLSGIGSFFQSLYESNPDAFMIAVLAVIVILLIIIIALAKAKGRAEGNKAIKYEDIDFSTEAERKAMETAPKEAEKPVSKGLPVVTEEDLRPKYGAFDVPNWMTKQTMSIDEANLIDADQWVGEQLGGQSPGDGSETPASSGETMSHTEFRAAAATGVIMSSKPGEPLREVMVKVPIREEEPQKIHLNESNLTEREAEQEPEAVEIPEEPQVVHLNESNLTERRSSQEEPEERRPETAPEPELEDETLNTDTLAKIMREQEEFMEDENDPAAGIRRALDQASERESYGTDISDAIKDEKPGIISMRTLGEDPSSAEVKREYDELLEGNVDFAGNSLSGRAGRADEDDELSGPIGGFAPRTAGRIHYGSHNRDTNRSGVRFTEDELMETIRE